MVRKEGEFMNNTVFMTKIDEFKVNDEIVYSGHGVGVIKKKEHKEIFGKMQDFYTVQIMGNKMKIFIPSEALNRLGVRKIHTSKEIEAIIKNLKVSKIQRTEWKTQYNKHLENLKTGEFEKLCQTLGQLSQLRPSQQLSYGERRMQEFAREQLANEISLASKLQYSDALEYVKENIG